LSDIEVNEEFVDSIHARIEDLIATWGPISASTAIFDPKASMKARAGSELPASLLNDF
jgi:hypothetical protein